MFLYFRGALGANVNEFYLPYMRKLIFSPLDGFRTKNIRPVLVAVYNNCNSAHFPLLMETLSHVSSKKPSLPHSNHDVHR